VLPAIANAKIHLQCTAEMISPSGEDPATKRPLFNHRKVTSTLTFASGGKAVLPAFPSEKAGHDIFVVLEASIVAASPNAARAATPPTVEGVLLEKARKIVFPEVKFQETPMVEAVAYLQQRSVELDPEGKGVKIIFRPGATSGNLSTNFKDIPLSAALQFIGSGPYELVAEKDSLVIQPRVDSGPASKISSEVAGGPGAGLLAENPTAAPAPDHATAGATSDHVVIITQDKVENDGSISKHIGKARRATYDSNTGTVVLTGKPSVQQGINLCVALNDSTVMTLNRDGRMKVDGASKIVIANSSTPESVLLEKAKKIVIPKFELRKNTVAEAAPMLQALSAEFDPEKKGVKIVAGPDSFNGTLTATLKDIPLSEALKYIATLSNSELQATGDAFVLWPLGPGGTPPPDAKPAKPDAAPGAALLPIAVDADETHMEGGMLVADGNARMKYGSTMVTADRLRYDRTTERMEFRGKVEIKYEKGTMRGEHVTVRFGPDGRILFGELDGDEAAPKASAPDAK
jgi:lipopolysaccharide export system protein LptA